MIIPIGPIIVAIILLVLLFWLLQQISLPEPIGRVIMICVVVLAVLWIVSLFGIGGMTVRLGG